MPSLTFAYDFALSESYMLSIGYVTVSPFGSVLYATFVVPYIRLFLTHLRKSGVFSFSNDPITRAAAADTIGAAMEVPLM